MENLNSDNGIRPELVAEDDSQLLVLKIPECLKSQTNLSSNPDEEVYFSDSEQNSINDLVTDQVWFHPNSGGEKVPVLHTTPYPHPGPESLLEGENYVEDLDFLTEGDPSPVVTATSDCTNLQKVVNLISNKDTRIPSLLVHSWEQQALWTLEYIGQIEATGGREYDPNEIFQHLTASVPRLLASWQGPYST
jgi:hypothetical protein